VQLLLQELREDPGNVETILEFGAILVELDRLPEAAEKFSRAVELEPANAMAHWSLGDLALQTGRPDQAVVEFELVQRLDPEYPSINLELAEAYQRLGDVNAARSRLRAHLAVEESLTETPESAVRVGGLLLDSGLFAEAALVLRDAVAQHAEEAALWRQLAYARFRAGDRSGGAEASLRLLELEPECAQAIHNLALATLDGGELEQAKSWITRGLTTWPNDSGFRHLRTRLWLARAGRWATGVSMHARLAARRVRRWIARIFR